MTYLESEFDITTRISKLTGLYLVAKAPDEEGLRFENRWSSCQAVYGIVLNSICTVFEISLLIFILYNEFSERVFSVAVFNILLVALYIKVSTGIAMYVLFGTKFVSILNDMARFEELIGYQPVSATYSCFSVRKLRAAARWLMITACVMSRYAMYEELSDTPATAASAAVSSVWSMVSAFIVYIASAEAHSLARLIYRVLSEYARHLSALALFATRIDGVADLPKNGYALLQDVRLKYLKLGHIARRLNEILQFSTFLSVTLSMVLLCTSVYIITHPGESLKKLVFSACYCVYIAFELYEMVLASTNLKDQVSDATSTNLCT
ncbi:hypothetical protein HPB50_007537 [Hyalomma asiaticum]|uniref:Uncharacterized protein n=1 Tax=Hyalomma asiaticum TaxID=266040 RepID=A0ACB7RPS3_HYAAI|nr:hypothetical protein HPB50_007537 [Hyalomma asiaticum]